MLILKSGRCDIPKLSKRGNRIRDSVKNSITKIVNYNVMIRNRIRIRYFSKFEC